MSQTFYVTTPIYYVNASPHLGHLYTTIVADALTRFMAQRGRDTFMLTGTDEHGINIERAAADAGIPVEAHVDRNTARFQEMIERFELRPSRFIRTTDPAHEAGAAHLYEVLRERGHIYKGEYEGWYCAGCNQYYTETEATAGGGVPTCPTHERPLEWLKEASWFFRLSAFQQPLLDHYESHPEFIRPTARRNEVISFVTGGLQDLSVSRAAVKWGIPVPGDPDHTLYVWLDALSNYITALGYGNATYQGFERFWPADVQLVGKDILRFHTVYWPAFLMGAGLPLPRTVFAHGMWLSEGRKMSKSLGNVIDLTELRKAFPLDTIRYFVFREMAFGEDADFNYPALIARHNGDLAGGLGNLASRSLTLVRSGLGSQLEGSDPGDEASAPVREAAHSARDRFIDRFGDFEFHRALEAAWELIGATDRYIANQKPWALQKDPAQRPALAQVLGVAAESLRFLAVLLSPVMPEATQALWGQLGLEGQAAAVDPATLAWGDGGPRAIGEVVGLFPRLNPEKTLAQLTGGGAAPARAPSPAPAPRAKGADPLAMPSGYRPGEGADNPLDYDTFLKADLRVGVILSAEPHPKADRLLKLTVDVGEGEPRQICAGIAAAYQPEELVGRRVLVVVNLAPRKLRGLVSQGMILAASEGEDGRPYLVAAPAEVPPGGRVR